MFTRILLAFSILAVACRSGPERISAAIHQATERGVVEAQRVSGGVRIVNGSSATISYVVVNPKWLGMLAPCTATAANCARVAAGAAVTVPDSDIHGFESSVTELAVRYWSEGAKEGEGKEVVVRF